MHSRELSPRPHPTFHPYLLVTVVAAKNGPEIGTYAADEEGSGRHERSDDGDPAGVVGRGPGFGLEFLRLSVDLVDALLSLFGRDAGAGRNNLDKILPI